MGNHLLVDHGMSSNQPPLLIKAKQQESEYDWLAAAESYKKTLGSVPTLDYLKTAQLHESSAHAFYQAAMQANTPAELKERLDLALEDYERANGFYERLVEPGRIPRTQRCQAKGATWLLASFRGAREKETDR